MEAPTTPIAPLEERESVEHLGARTLRDLIVDGKLPEGTPLVQRELAQQLGVSPTPVRAGLSQLEREGFVVVTPTGRALVRRLTREDFEEIYAARLGLEGLAARLGAYAVGREDIAGMKVTCVTCAVSPPSRTSRSTCGSAGSSTPPVTGRAAASGSSTRSSGCSGGADRYNRLVLSTAQRFRESVGRYQGFLAACEAHDGERAEEIVQESIRWAFGRAADSVPSEAEGA